MQDKQFFLLGVLDAPTAYHLWGQALIFHVTAWTTAAPPGDPDKLTAHLGSASVDA